MRKILSGLGPLYVRKWLSYSYLKSNKIFFILKLNISVSFSKNPSIGDHLRFGFWGSHLNRRTQMVLLRGFGHYRTPYFEQHNTFSINLNIENACLMGVFEKSANWWPPPILIWRVSYEASVSQLSIEGFWGSVGLKISLPEPF